jgi:hypothetical protein
VVDAFTVDGAKDWTAIWWVPCALAAAIALFFAVTFKDRAESEQPAHEIKAAVKEA